MVLTHPFPRRTEWTFTRMHALHRIVEPSWYVRVLEEDQTRAAVADAFGVCLETVSKWVKRFREEGVEGLLDRSSRPHKLRQPTPEPVIKRIEELRRRRWTGLQIANQVGVSLATVGRVLKGLGLNKLKALEPATPVRRYERKAPGEMIHIDIKKLGKFSRTGHRIIGKHKGRSGSRGSGWEFVHVLHRRLLPGRLHPDLA